MFYEKRAVVLWKTTRHFIENNTSFCEEQHVVFRRHSLFAWEGPQIGHWLWEVENQFVLLPYAQERGADCSYSTQKCLKLYCQPFGRNGGLYILRYKALYQYGVRDGERSRGEAAHTFLKQTYIKQWNFDLKLGRKKSLCAITWVKRGDLKPNWG